MAKLHNGVFGPFSGKLGPLVGASWKNIPYLRSLPTKKPGRSQTPAQLACQQKFKFVTEWLVPFHPFVTVGFQNLAQRRTEINAAFSINYKEAITGVYPYLGVDYSKVKLSKGPLPELVDPELHLKAPNVLELRWSQHQLLHAAYDDQLMLVLYSPELKIADGFIGGVKRADLSCEFKFNPKMVGKTLEAYVALVSLNGKKIANSSYLGKVGPL